MTDRREPTHVSFHRIADRLTLIKLGVHSVRRRLRWGVPVEPDAVATQLARIDQEVEAAAAALTNLAPEQAGDDPDREPPLRGAQAR